MRRYIVVPILFHLCCYIGSADRQCNDAYECSTTRVNFTTLIIANQTSIHCYGDHSCFKSPSISNTDVNIECSGSFACANSTSVILNSLDTTITADINCDGLFSCAFVENLFNFEDDIDCDAELSCFGSVLGANGILSCNGDRSCANTHFTLGDSNPDEVVFAGYLSAQNALLYEDKYSIIYHFFGANSGDGAEILCANGIGCEIYCYGNACSNIKSIECDGSCEITVECNNAEKSDICPDGYELAPFIDYSLPDPEYSYSSSVMTSSDVCNDSSQTFIHCDDYQECLNSENLESTESNTGAICCSAVQGCSDADTIRIILDSNNNSDNDVALRCDGYDSCSLSSLIYAQNGGDIYLSGTSATGDSAVTIEGSAEHDIVCSGRYSCNDNIIENCDNLYCTASNACQECSKIQFVNNIWAYGRLSLYMSTVSSIYNSIYCGGYQSCMYTVISDVNGDVYGHSHQVLYGATIDSVNGSVYGIGTAALCKAHIQNVKNVCKNNNSYCLNASANNKCFSMSRSVFKCFLSLEICTCYLCCTNKKMLSC